MNNKQALRNGVIVLAILVATSLVAVLWPGLIVGIGSNGGGGGGVSAPSIEITTVTLPDMPLLGGLAGSEVNSLLVLAVIAGGIIAVVVGAGVVLGLVYMLLARLAANNAELDSFKEAQAALQQKQKETVKALNADRSTTGPNPEMPRWAAVSTSLTVLFFVTLFGMIINALFATSGQQGSALLSSPIVGGLLLVALVLIGWRVRPQRMVQTEGDNNGVPWDFVVVLVTGLLVVGLSVGWLLYINSPS